MRRAVKFAAVATFTLLANGAVLLPAVNGQQPNGNPPKNPEDGLTINKPSAFQGYSLVAPMNSTSTYLIDMEGRIVNEWKSDYTPALSAYLLPNGHLLRPGAERGRGGPGGTGGQGMGDRRGRDSDGPGPGGPGGGPSGPGGGAPGGPGGGAPGGGGAGGPGGGFGGPGGPGGGGRIQEVDWDGTLVWNFSFKEAFPNSKLQPHHDICALPNGNVLVVCSDPKTKEESVAAGRLPPIAPDQLLADAILEIKPVGKTGGEIVWEWHAWDHLVQEVHKEKPNFGDISEHPERIDVNFVTGMMDRLLQDPEQLAKLRSLGYVGGATQPRNAPPRDGGQQPNGPDGGGRGPGGPGGGGGPGGFGGPGGGGDWMHVNSVTHNAKSDQIMISVHEFSEVWIIDHSTTTAQAASGAGGRYGKGGDLLYRWGNPKAYRNGTNADQRLFAQHCAHWIADGLPGAGHMLVFNNGMNRPDGTYSTIDEIELPVTKDGAYEKKEFVSFEPLAATWSYGSKDKPTFFSMLISGAQRLPNGNTYICSGTQGLLLEVTPGGEIVWQFKYPGGGMGFGGPDGFRTGGILPGFLAGMLRLDDDQRGKIKTLQDDTDAKLKDLLTEDQHKKLNAPQGFPGPGGFTPPTPGEVISDAKKKELALTEEQATKVAMMQKDVTTRLNEILTQQQRDQIEDMGRRFAGGGFGGPGRGPQGGPDGPPRGNGGPGNGGGPGGPGFGPQGGQDGPPRGNGGPGNGGPGFGPPGGFGGGGFGGPGGPGRGFGGPGGPGGGPGGMFRSYRYGPEFAGLKDKTLTPGKKLVDVVAAQNPDRQRPGADRGPRPEPDRD